ncbi:hypothetical protein KR018_010461 [Drosophila ironensis]|nr:hypothetical protein KR018_010461 [Drosophila ironensis]
MSSSLWLSLGLSIVLLGQSLGDFDHYNVVCFYDSRSRQQDTDQWFTLSDIHRALYFCTHLVYSHLGVNADNYELQSIDERMHFDVRHLKEIVNWRKLHPHVKFILSVGGNQYSNEEYQYLKLLESGEQGHKRFIESARDLVRRVNFDGIDLAFPLPRNKARKDHGDVGDSIVDPDSEAHKAQMTGLIKELSAAFKENDLLVSLTVLPNVNSSLYYDASSIAPSLDFINLGTFDFLTPQRNPKEADFSAPLYEPFGQNRLSHYNVVFQLEHWLLQGAPANKLNIGIATYGRAWKMTKDSGTSGEPVVHKTSGPAPAGNLSKIEGLLSSSEICQLMPNRRNENLRGPMAPVTRVQDPTKRYGSYFFRPADENGDNGLWISYDDTLSAAIKKHYVQVNDLGGLALFDLNQDDFRGECLIGYPILNAIRGPLRRD